MAFNEQLIKGLRPYQKQAIDMAYDFMASNPGGNPCIVMPTGSGKSWVIAGICENLMRRAPECKILVLTHRKELIEQDRDKIFKAWPEGRDRVGVVCAGLRESGIRQITVASVQTLARRLDQLNNDKGRIELTIIDEAHMIGKGNTTKQYRSVLDRVLELNPAARMIGLTATPYRLGQGRLDEGPGALFTKCIEPVTIQELVDQKYLVPLRSKFEEHFDLTGVRKQNGDYQINDLEAKINTDEINARIVSEAIARGAGRHAWLFFCVSKRHANAMRQELKSRGIHAEVLLGDTPSGKRAELLERFRTGELKALTSVGVLTTGFDAPIIDMLVMARPTMSTALYVQMAGRGMRLSPETGKTDCLMLDFAGLVEQHGPITRVKETGVRTAVCPNKKCREIICADEKICPACGTVIQTPEPEDKGEVVYTCKSCNATYTVKELAAFIDFERSRTWACLDCHAPIVLDEDAIEAVKEYLANKPVRRGPSEVRFNNDVMGGDVPEPKTKGLKMDVKSWRWSATTTKKGDNALIVTYYPNDYINKPVTEWLNVCSKFDSTRQNSIMTVNELAKKIGVYNKLMAVTKDFYGRALSLEQLERIVTIFRTNEVILHPTSIEYDIKNGYPKITARHWSQRRAASAVSQTSKPTQPQVIDLDNVTKDLARYLEGEVLVYRDHEKEGDYHVQIAR